ncbi:uncharacterized protein BDR25DRAFT_382128 [Lindgomyces ingoldianus]|uniref:Uncharacterized protein n=1 Tax=Lindgomyces ingoldianus TaxID=673940 RepID=A0ACB6R906_9PLEO|nr:uncharacterized protein BDR25DRAFT_382128 [Lindgomyces ingoldianus]KAF2475253.1 hypothetical protein BDR25DRAFT_382128 [Lindgomyces ingoldianus]
MNSTPLFGIGSGAQSTILPTPPLSQTVILPARQAEIQVPSNSQLPPLVQILDIFFRQNATGQFFSGATAMNDAQFTGQRPIVGVGHHFVVYASPFAKLDTTPERVARVGGEVYCIKSPNLDRGLNEKGFRKEYYHTVLEELRVLSHPSLINHENIIGLLGLDFLEDYDDFRLAWPLLLVEYSEFGTLDAFQEDLGGLQPTCVRNLLLDIAIGLQTLHNCNIIHGDVKSENVLVFGHPIRQYVAKLSDFGLAVVSPSAAEQHYLPGCTWLWSAPEAQQKLSVLGMQLTDVYSFGLTAWRVLMNCQDPFQWISRNLEAPSNQHQFVQQMKMSPAFPQAVIQSLSGLGNSGFARQVIVATLSLEPTERSLESAIHALSDSGFGRSDAASVNPSRDLSENTQQIWEPESPEAVVRTLTNVFPWDFLTLQSRPSVIFSLLEDLEAIMSSNTPAALPAATIHFKLITTPGIQLGDKSVANQVRILHRLCDLGSQSHRAIAHIYCKLNKQALPGCFSTSWLEEAAWVGSFSALHTLKVDFPGDFHEWERKIEDNASNSAAGNIGNYDHMLLAYCRTGNLPQCHAMLDAGASALSDWDEPGALHFLAVHRDADLSTLTDRLIDAGAALDHWEGSEMDDDFLLGRCSGTPMHWAVFHQNLAFIRVLARRDKSVQEANLKRAFFIAAVMNFHDVLEILWDWAMDGNYNVPTEWVSTFRIVAAAHLEHHLPRLLRHGDNVDIAMSQTFEILFMMSSPSKPECSSCIDLLNLGVIHNRTGFVQYLLRRFDIPKTISIPHEKKDVFLSYAILSGFVDMFELFYEYKLFSLDHRSSADKFTGIQMCLAARQRNPVFVRRYIEWGCSVDEMGDSQVAEWTPFTMAVQCGLYDIASMLLQHGADKDATTGWLGGTTPLFHILHAWPDVPISRVKYLLEDLPRQGFGHVSFIGWPANGANILYCFSMAVWSHYRNSYKFSETMKFVLSMMGDKTCINQLDRIGCTALNQAARSGNLEVVRVLIEAGADVNGGLGIAPLDAALEWRDKWAKKEREAMKRQVIGERRHATKIRERADELIHLLQLNGAQERGVIENNQMMMSTITSGNYKLPSMEMLFEMASVLFDKSSTVNQGSIKPHPTKRDDFTAHHGITNRTQKAFRMFGRMIDQSLGSTSNPHPRFKSRQKIVVTLYCPHSCHPWLPCQFANGYDPQGGNQGSSPSTKSNVSQPISQLHILQSPGRQNDQWNSSTSTLIPSPQKSQPLASQSNQNQQVRPITMPGMPTMPISGFHSELNRPNTLPSMSSMQIFSEVNHLPSGTTDSSQTAPSPQWHPPIAVSPQHQPPYQSPNHRASLSPPTRSSELVISRLRTSLTSIRSPSSLSPSSSTDDLYSLDPPSNTQPPLDSIGARSLEILRSEFSQPIQLLYRACGVEEIIDIALIESTVADALGADLMRELKISFVPELQKDGRELWMHLCCVVIQENE